MSERTGEFLIIIQPDAPKFYSTVTITADELAASSAPDKASFRRAILDIFKPRTDEPETKPMSG